MNASANAVPEGALGVNVVVSIIAFGVFVLSFLWGGVYTQLATERNADLKAAAHNVSNLSRLIEEHTLRTMREADRLLLFIIDRHREQGDKIDLRRLAEDGPITSKIYTYFSIIDEHGRLVAGSRPFKMTNFADREHFQAHVASDTRQLFISKPVIDRASGKLSLQLSRRINKPDLSFGGVAVVSVDTGYFTAFYGNMDLGNDSVISIAGSDGTVRASSRASSATATPHGGTLFAAGTARPADDVPRIVSTRALAEYPLAVTVGLSLDEVLSSFRQRRKTYVVAGAVASLAIVLFTLFLLAVLRRQLAITRALAKSNAELIREGETKAHLAAIIESSTDAIFSRTLDGTPLTWNTGAERLFGWGAAEIVGKTTEMLIPPECRHEVLNNARILEREGVVSAYDTVRLHRDGRRIDVSVMLSPIRNQTGEMSGLSIIMRDITDRKCTERALQELRVSLESKVAERTAALDAVNEQLQSFAYSASHDLRAPLRAIDGFAKALDENTLGLDAENRKRIERIRGSARRMAELIDSMLRFARLGQVQVAAKPHDVDAQVSEVVLEVRAEYPHVNLMKHDLGRVRGDPSLLRQVWVNLINNAAKFSSQSQNPVIHNERVDYAGEPAFRIKDNGAGFDTQYAGKLFGLFQRMHRQDQFPGTGAGLAIVKRIVERHGGRVWANAAPGKGASFYFTLGAHLMTDSVAEEPVKGTSRCPA